MSLRELLTKHSQQVVTSAELDRAFVKNRDWIVPVMQFREEILAKSQQANPGSPDAEIRLDHDIVLYSNDVRLPKDELWLFTDHEAATRAQHQGLLLGMCERGVDGTEIFGSLDPKWKRVVINPGSPAQEGCVFLPNASGDPYRPLRLLANAILLEDAFQAAPQAPETMERLKQYEGFQILIWNDDSTCFLHINNPAGLANVPIVCTTPDCVESVVKRLLPEQRARGVSVIEIDGVKLLSALAEGGYDGLSFNPMGPGFRWLLRL